LGSLRNCETERRIHYRIERSGTRDRVQDLPARGAGDAQTDSPEQTRADPRGSETILLVEDEAFLRQKICEVLESAGYRVLVAEDGEEGFQLATRHERQIHLLLTDVVMPNLSGLGLTNRLRTSCPGTKTLYMSGYPDMCEGSETLRSQPNFIQKPFTQEELLCRARDVLDSNTTGIAAEPGLHRANN